jgi:phage terminase small subunit
MPGPPKKPTALKAYEGFPGHKPLPQNEPLYPNGLPDKPKMSMAASRIWNQLVREMSVSGVLKRVDAQALRQLCEDEAALEKAYAGFWQMIGKIKAKAKREKKQLPGGEVLALLSTQAGAASLRTIRDLGRSLILQRREFGLTPSARTRIMVEARERPQDSIDDAVFNQSAELFILPKPG